MSQHEPEHEPAPAQQARSRTTTRRRIALAALLVGTTGLLAWRSTPMVLQSAQPGIGGVGDDVCVVAPPTPYEAASGVPLNAPREVPADARCPVCGMYPARARAWAAQVIFADGDAYFFDSPLSLVMYLGNTDHYTRGRKADAIVARYVTDTESGRWLDALQAVYVAGSSAMGPMRAGNLPAFANLAAARRFAQQRGGSALAWGAIGAPLLQKLTPNLRADHRNHAG